MSFIHDGAASPPSLVYSSLFDRFLDMFTWMSDVYNTSPKKFWPGAEGRHTRIS